jgi:4'-phosphopantetheinyl transferase
VSVPLVYLAGAASELPAGREWLQPAERETLLRFRAPKRRRDFRLGRYVAKRALAMLEAGEAPCDFRRFELRPAPGGAPLAFRDGAGLPVALSLSHSDGWAVAAVQRGIGPLGCDLERIERRSPAFLEDYFTPSERAFVAEGAQGASPLRATLLWSAKEAVMKALGEGLRLAPQAVEVLPSMGTASGAGWRRFSVAAPPVAARLHGFWCTVGGFVLTVVGGPGEPLQARGATR